MINLAALLNSAAAIVGTTGAGKTYTAKGVVEHLLAIGRRVIIIDPTGAWYGLRSGEDGRQPGGFPVIIFGGEHADVPIEPTAEAGKALALALAERDVQAIIDTSEMTGGEKNRFLTPFLENLYARNKAALHLIVDEADEVAAQRLADGEQRLFGAFDKIVRRGRIKGFRPLMISQRPAVIHKNVLSQIGTLIALKLTSPQDRKAIEEWVKGNADADQAKAVMTSLPTLGRGEGWVWSPAETVLERVTFPPISTFDSSRTPDADDVVVEPALTTVDVATLREAMQTSSDGSVTPAAARKAVIADVEAAEQRGYVWGYETCRNDQHASSYRSGFHDAAVKIIEVATRQSKLDPDDIDIPALPVTSAEIAKPTPPRRKSEPSARGTPPAANLAGDPFLNAALQVWPAKMTWAGLASMCGRKARGGSFNTRRRHLLDGGHVREDGDLVVPCNPPETPAGVIPADLLEQNLPTSSAEAFKIIRRQPGISIEDLAANLGVVPRGGSWNTRMAILRRNNLITETNGLRIADGLDAGQQTRGA